jgi:hypothetical protein
METLAEDEGHLLHFAYCASLMRQPRFASRALGLANHPSLLKLQYGSRRFGRDAMHAKVIYHADPWTLYTDSRKLPDFGLGGDGDCSMIPATPAVNSEPQLSDPGFYLSCVIW